MGFLPVLVVNEWYFSCILCIFFQHHSSSSHGVFSFLLSPPPYIPHISMSTVSILLYVFPHFLSPFCPMFSETLKGSYGYPFTFNLPIYSKFQCWCLYGRILHYVRRSQLAGQEIWTDNTSFPQRNLWGPVWLAEGVPTVYCDGSFLTSLMWRFKKQVYWI